MLLLLFYSALEIWEGSTGVQLGVTFYLIGGTGTENARFLRYNAEEELWEEQVNRALDYNLYQTRVLQVDREHLKCYP